MPGGDQVTERELLMYLLVMMLHPGSLARHHAPACHAACGHLQVYVLGQRTVVCQRPSLGENYLGQEAKRAGVLSLPRISCKSTYAKDSPEYRFSAGVIYGTGNGTGAGVRTCGVAPVATSTAEVQTCSSRGGAAGGTAGSGLQGSGHGAADASTGPDSSEQAVLRRARSPHSPPPPAPPGSPPSTPPHPGSAAEASGGEAPAGPVAQTTPSAHFAPTVAQSMVPPDWVTSALSGALREKLGLQLFNFDMICPVQQPAEGERLYHVVRGFALGLEMVE